MQHEQWATVQLEQPNFVARKGLSSLIGCYFVSFTIIAIVGFSAPTPIQTKVYRDVDYGAVEISGTSLTIDKVNGDALWDLKIHDLNSEKQFVFINAKVQRPGWNTVSGHQMDFSYQQEYTLFSQQGTSSHFLRKHSDVMANNTHTAKVKCRRNKRFCDSITIYHKDYLAASQLHLRVLFHKPQVIVSRKRFLSKEEGISGETVSEPSLFPTPQVVMPTPAPTEDFFLFHQNATWTVLMQKVNMNEDFTKFELKFRYSFLVVTLLIGFRFLRQLNKLSVQMWGYQQRWVIVLLLFLVLFDGPLSAARIYGFSQVNLQDHDVDETQGRQKDSVIDEVNSNRLSLRILSDISMFCTTSFVAVSLIYYLCLLEEMGSGGVWKFCGWGFCANRTLSNALKVVVVGSFWAITFICYLIVAHESEHDPSFTLFGDNTRDEPTNTFKYLVACLGALFTIYFVWLGALVLDAFRALRSLTAPFQFIAAATFISIILTISGVFLGGFYFIPPTAASFAVFFGCTNLYVYALAFGYMPQLEGMALASNDEDNQSFLEMIETESGFMKEAHTDFELSTEEAELIDDIEHIE